MGIQAKKIEIITISMEAKAGSLAKIYSAFRESGVDILSSWAYEMSPGKANAHFYAANSVKAIDVLAKMGIQSTREAACFCEGENKVGNYADILNKVAKAGLNIHATDAIVVGGKFAAVIFADQKDIPEVCKVLGV